MLTIQLTRQRIEHATAAASITTLPDDHESVWVVVAALYVLAAPGQAAIEAVD
jgi:hypothetical protein